jgi:hypothetical protein
VKLHDFVTPSWWIFPTGKELQQGGRSATIHLPPFAYSYSKYSVAFLDITDQKQAQTNFKI